MPRPTTSIDAVVREAMGEVIQRAAQDIARAIADLAADALASRLESTVARTGGRSAVKPAAARRPARGELNRWVADRRARRVPTFVIELTGLKTKKQIVARYGADASFEKGKPAPRPRG